MRFIEQWTSALKNYGEAPYVSHPQFALRGAEAESKIREYTAALLAHGVKAGDVVAFYGRADAEWLILQAAILRAAASVALLPPLADESLLVRVIAQCNPKYVIASTEDDAERVIRCMKAVPSIVQTIVQHGKIRNPACVSLTLLVKGGEPYLKEKADELERRDRILTADDTALIVFSAGTMGLPRIVRISHERLGRQVAEIAEKLGQGPALYSSGKMELIDHAVLLYAGILQKREIVFGEPPPQRDWEWVGTADEIADSLFSLAWPVVGPQALPRGFGAFFFQRKVRSALKKAFPYFQGAHTGFTVLPPPLIDQMADNHLRLTWGYGAVEMFGFGTWEENLSGFGLQLPHVQLATHAGKLVFDWAENPTAWWQSTGDWARTLGPWIAELEPHGVERGEPQALLAARRIEREIAAHPWIASAFVSGPEPLANLVLLSLRSEPVFAWARQQGVPYSDWDGLLERPEIVGLLLARVRAIGHRHGVQLNPVILKKGLSVAEGERTSRGEFRRALIVRHAGSYSQSPRPVQ